MLIKDKVVIISGIGPGLGIALALTAAKEGAKGIALAARTQSKLDEAVAAVEALGLGTEVLAVATDIAQPEQCQNLVDQVVAKWGQIDGLINSAYIPGDFGPMEAANFDDWRKTLDVNLFGSVGLSQAVFPQMKKQGSGAIVMVNSMVVKKMMPYQGGYATSKGALVSATKALASEWGAYGIRVNSVHMGWMWGQNVQAFVQQSAAQQGVSEEKILKGITRNIPLGRMPTDTECAPSAIYLLSDYASVITGASLDVNGGEYMP